MTSSNKVKTKKRYSISTSPLMNISNESNNMTKQRTSKLKHKFTKPYLYDYMPIKRRSIRRSKRYRTNSRGGETTKSYNTLSRKVKKKERRLPTLEELLDDSLDINDKVDLKNTLKKNKHISEEDKLDWIDLKDIKLKE